MHKNVTLRYVRQYLTPSTEKLTQTLEIRDQEEADFSPPLSLHSSSNPATATHTSHTTTTIDSLTHHVEVQVLESGQVAMSSSSGTGFLSTESTTPPVLGRDTFASLRDTESHVEPMTATSTPRSKRGLPAAAVLQRRVPGIYSTSTTAVGSSSLGSVKASLEDQVEVDGQFDMPILDSVSSENVSTGSSAVMTFVMTSEGLSHTVSGHEGEKQRQPSSLALSPVPSNVRSVGLQTQHTSTDSQPSSSQATPNAPPTTPPAAVAVSGRELMKERESADAGTQTASAKVRPEEVEDRTPLIIRRSRAGRVRKWSISSNTRRQSDNVGVKFVEPSTENGNETTCREIQIQTQSPFGMRQSSVGVQATEGIAKEPSSKNSKQPTSPTPRRSTRKTTHKLSPEKSKSAVRTVKSPSAKSSGTNSARRSPVVVSPVASDGVQNSPRVRTRSATKRCGVDEEWSAEGRDTPPAKRSRKATTERSRGKHPQLWGVNEVAEFINGFQRDCTNTFREHVS